DASLADFRSTRLELRLHQHQRFPAGRGECESRRQREANADERDVANDEVGDERKLAELARIRALEDGDTRVGSEPFVQLSVADVDRGDTRGPSLQQNVGEAARGGADVEAVASGRIHPE